ncbi:MAG: single-stranded DNA-binding protein [Bacteroidetes bacterium]|nr:single-stranded DNA-binding protein [Bacteroidota bacterium]
MAGINKVILIGNLGKDPETFTFENGVKKVSFSLATTESYKDKEGNKVDQTEWHNVVVWRGLADVAEKYLSKGNQVYIEGKIKTRAWDDKDGVKRYTTEIYADNMTMLGGKRDDSQTERPTQKAPEVDIPEPEDDLPF